MWFLFKKAEKFEKRKITLHFKHKHKSYIYTDEAVLASVCWNFVHFFSHSANKEQTPPLPQEPSGFETGQLTLL